MKKISLLLLAVGGALMLSLNACTDECKDITCENGGTCDEGVCTCTDNYFGDKCETRCVNGSYSGGTCSCSDGYEGASCETEWSEKFEGTYNGDDDCGFTYQSVVAASDEATLTITNFAGTNTTATVTVTSSDHVSIASQTNGGFTYSGSGSISGTTLTIDYTLSDGAITDNCKVVYTR